MSQNRVTGKRVLLAEDESQVREAIRLLLSVDEHQVTEARDGREALSMYEPGRFDLVITDFVMPRMQGDELVIEIKRRDPAQRVLMISAYMQERTGASNPADALLPKPFSFGDLRQAIARLLG